MARAPDVVRRSFHLAGAEAASLVGWLGFDSTRDVLLELPLPPHVDVRGDNPTVGRVVPTTTSALRFVAHSATLALEGLWADLETGSRFDATNTTIFQLWSPDLGAEALCVQMDDRMFPLGDRFEIGRGKEPLESAIRESRASTLASRARPMAISCNTSAGSRRT